jgi:hypothetical protein
MTKHLTKNLTSTPRRIAALAALAVAAVPLGIVSLGTFAVSYGFWYR